MTKNIGRWYFISYIKVTEFFNRKSTVSTGTDIVNKNILSQLSLVIKYHEKRLPLVLIFSFFLASRNISDWWLAYWISHDKQSSSTNHTSSSGHMFFGDSRDLNAMHLNVKKGSLSFYLVVYGGIAFANTVR